MGFLLALQFLTRIPVHQRSAVTERQLARSMAYYPLVGLLLGGAAALLHLLLVRFTAAAVADLAAVALLVLLTGNIHLDGLMDTADGIWSGRPREQMLEIMRDSRVGSHAVTAGILVLLAKIIILGQIPPDAKTAALLLFPVLGRWSMVYAATIHPYARSQGLGSFTAYLGKWQLIFASAVTVAVSYYLLQTAGLMLCGAVLAGAVLLAAYLVRRVGGMTGDLFGAVNELMEVLALFILLLILF